LIDAADVVLDGVIRYDVRFFESLNRMVQAEPWLERDRAMIDGSVDVYFAPKAPKGKDSNWIPTDADGRFEALFRLYGPEKAFFERSGCFRISKK
jgi:hypothetical protein